MEVGRSAVTGDGEFWMEAETIETAHNMHAAMLGAMTNLKANNEANRIILGYIYRIIILNLLFFKICINIKFN